MNYNILKAKIFFNPDHSAIINVGCTSVPQETVIMWGQKLNVMDLV